MAGPKAMLWLSDRSFREVPPATALRYWEILRGREEPTDEEGEKLAHIRDVFFSPSIQPPDYTEVHKFAKAITTRPADKVRPAVSQLKDENTLPDWTAGIKPSYELDTRPEHELDRGVLQGVDEKLPRGDR